MYLCLAMPIDSVPVKGGVFQYRLLSILFGSQCCTTEDSKIIVMSSSKLCLDPVSYFWILHVVTIAPTMMLNLVNLMRRNCIVCFTHKKQTNITQHV